MVLTSLLQNKSTLFFDTYETSVAGPGGSRLKAWDCAARFLGSRVRIPMDVFICECCVLSGRGL